MTNNVLYLKKQEVNVCYNIWFWELEKRRKNVDKD